jgi:hypothetical protein
VKTRNVYVKLPDDVADTLVRVSLRDGVHPKERAAALISEGLRRAGALPNRKIAPAASATAR